MFGILCLLASFVLAENAIIDYKLGLIALNDPNEIPSNLKDVIEILSTDSTVLIPQEYGTSLYIGHERSDDGETRSLKFAFWPDLDDECADYGIRLYRYSHNQINMQYEDFKFSNERFHWNDDMWAGQKNLSGLTFTIEDRMMYLHDHFTKNRKKEKAIDSKQCASNQGKFVICRLHFQLLGECPLRLKFEPEHKVVLFMPSVPEGDSYFKKVFTRDSEIERTSTTAKLESTSLPFYEDDATEAETTTSNPPQRREIPLSNEWLVTLLVLECFVLTFSGAGAVFVYFKKCRKAKKHEGEHHSEDEELENVLENLALRPPPPNQGSIQRRVTSPRTQLVSQLIFNPEGNESTKTAIPKSAKNASKPKPKVIAITRPTSPLKAAVFTSAGKKTVKPKSSKKSKSKNAVKKAKDKPKPKSKSNSAKKKLPKKAADDAPNDISIRREYMKKRKLALDEKQQTTTQKTFVNDDGVKVYGVDAEGCEQTQHSEDDSYRAQIQDALLARREGS